MAFPMLLAEALSRSWTPVARTDLHGLRSVRPIHVHRASHPRERRAGDPAGKRWHRRLYRRSSIRTNPRDRADHRRSKHARNRTVYHAVSRLNSSFALARMLFIRSRFTLLLFSFRQQGQFGPPGSARNFRGVSLDSDQARGMFSISSDTIPSGTPDAS